MRRESVKRGSLAEGASDRLFSFSTTRNTHALEAENMLNLVPEDLESYIRQHSSPEPELLTALSKETHERTDQPQMLVGHIEGRFLTLLARAMGARRVLEIGTYTGYSALCLAEGVADGGDVITCDINQTFATIAEQFWARSPHGSKITQRLGRAIDTIGDVDGPFDIVFLDADKESYIDYWEACVPKVRTGGLLLADNVLWSGRVIDPQEPVARAVDKFNKHVAADARVECAVLTIRDGITMAYKY
jgi:caffeoyl-CoA O-methyltransferase